MPSVTLSSISSGSSFVGSALGSKITSKPSTAVVSVVTGSNMNPKLSRCLGVKFTSYGPTTLIPAASAVTGAEHTTGTVFHGMSQCLR